MQKQQPGKRSKKNKNPPPQYQNLNPFKELQKHFKYYQHTKTDFSIVYQPQEYQNVLGYQVAALPYPSGAYLVRNFNNSQIVHQIAIQALNQYWQPPYRTNLDSRQEMYQEQKEVKQEQKQKQKEQTVLQSKEQKIVREQGFEQKGYYFNDKIRWANVGYQYDWTARKYPNMKTEFPQTIESLCARANQLYIVLREQPKDYYPQSAIINYYSEKDYMTGHLDDAEIDQESPIYSFSLGLSCIFLIGGKTKQTKPVPVRLNSGDLLIMGGQSRLTYHGVPRIISKSFTPPKKADIEQKKEWKNKANNVGNYLSSHRININVRQVYPRKQ